MSPMNPTQVYVAHYRDGYSGPVLCGIYNPIRSTDDPALVTCRRCRKAIDRQIGQLLDQAIAR